MTEALIESKLNAGLLLLLHPSPAVPPPPPPPWAPRVPCPPHVQSAEKLLLQVVDRSISQGLRPVALAMGHMDVDMQELDMDALTLQQAQDLATKLDLLGLKLLSNYTRTDSRETVQQLQEQYVLKPGVLCCPASICLLHTLSHR